MPFIDRINEIPFAPTTPNGRGVLPPMIRAIGHVLYLAGRSAEENPTVTPEEASQELTDAHQHWTAIDATSLSDRATETINTIAIAVTDASQEYEGWSPEDRITNLRNLANRMATVSAILDRELIGLRDSDAGTAL